MRRWTLCLVLLLTPLAWGDTDEMPFVPVLTHVESTFDAGPEGWTSSDGEASLAVVDGHLEARDITNAWLWLTAPSAFHGDWRRLGRVTLVVRGDDAVLTESVRIHLGSPHGSASFTFPREAVVPGTWRTLGVPLDAAQWEVAGDWDAILATVDSFQVRLDLHRGTDETEVEALDLIRVSGTAASTFSSGLEDWTATDDATLDATAGHLTVTDTAKGWVWLVAPWQLRGDWREHKRLSFDIRATSEADVVYPVVVELRGGETLARYVFPVDAVAAGEWRTLSVPLEEALWTVAGDWSTLLANVADLRIRLDLTSAWGGDAEANGFDNCRLTPR